MSSSEQKREDGSALIAIGWVLVLFACLVLFFHPAGLKLGQTRFAVIAASLAAAGLVTAGVGMWLRKRSG